MPQTPFRARRLRPADVRRIVRRAAELAEVDPASAETGCAFTEDELEQRLGALGFPREVVRRAIAVPSPAEPPTVVDGARVVHEEVVDGVVPPERHEDVADAIASAMGIAGRVGVVGNKITWTPGGIALEPAVTVHSKDGRTHVRVEETLANRGQVLVACITLGGLAGLTASPFGLGLAKLLDASSAVSAAVTAALSLAAALATVVGLRRLFARRVSTRRHVLGEGLSRIVTAVHAVVASAPARLRVAAGAQDAAGEVPDDTGGAEIEAAVAEAGHGGS